MLPRGRRADVADRRTGPVAAGAAGGRAPDSTPAAVAVAGGSLKVRDC